MGPTLKLEGIPSFALDETVSGVVLVGLESQFRQSRLLLEPAGLK